MSGTWPQLDVQDFTLRSRHYLNELIAKFYQDAELWRYMSQSAREIAQRGSAVRRILDAVTVNATRTVSHNAYRCHHVEYLPSSGRTEMLEKIDPLQVGHKTYDGSAPQYWYEDVGNIGLDPLPDAAYNLRLYVSDVPMVKVFTATGFTGWSAGTDWVASSAYAYHNIGAASSDLTYSTATMTPSVKHVISFLATSFAASSSLTPYIGATAGTTVTKDGYHTQIITAPSGTPSLIFRAVDYVLVDNPSVYKEADFSTITDLSDLPPIWNHTLVLMTLLQALQRDNRSVMSKVLSILTAGEIDYLRSNLIEVIPDSKATRWGER